MNNQNTAPLARTEQRPGYFWADNELMDVYGPRIGAYGVAVYLTLCRYANNKTGQCQVKIKTVANMLNVSSRTVQRALKTLTDHGLIMIEASIVEKNGARVNDANVFTILAVEKKPHDSQTPPVLKTPPPCQIDTPPVTVGHTNNKTHENKTEINKTGAAIKESAHQRLMAKRVELFGKTPNLGREAKALKWMLDNGFAEAQIAEHMAHVDQAAKANGFAPSLELCARQIDGYFKRKNAPAQPAGRTGFISQADINAPRGRVVL